MKEVKLTIPTEWSDITVEVYQKYIKLQESKTEEEKLVVKSLALLCNTTEEVVMQMEYKDLLDIMNILKKMLDKEPGEITFQKVFKFKGEEYGFVPNLSKLSTGEYIDLEAYCKDDPMENLHIIMSILFRKVVNKRNERYSIEPYDPDQFKEELFKDCPMNVALGALGFFLTLGLNLENALHRSLGQQEKKQKL